MRAAPILLAPVMTAGGCQAPPALGQDGKVIDQGAIADIACGPCAMLNWMSHGGDELREVYATVSDGKTPVETVRQIIDTYGTGRSAALTTEKVRTSRPLPQKAIITAHFATFAAS